VARSVGPVGVGGRRPLESNRCRKETPVAASSRATCQQLRSRERLRQGTTSRQKSSTFQSEDGNASRLHSSIRLSERSGAAGGRALHHCLGDGGRRARVAPVRGRPSVGREYCRWTRNSSSATQAHESTRGRGVAGAAGRRASHQCSEGGGKRARVAPVREKQSDGREYRREKRHSSSATQFH